MMSLKCVKEFIENLVFGFLTSEDIRMFFTIVYAFDIGNIKVSIMILVHNVKGFHGKTGSKLVHRSSDSSQELIVIDSTIAVSVKFIESHNHLLLSKTESHLSKCLDHLRLLKSFVTVIIIDTEKATQSHNSRSTARLQLISNLFDNRRLALGLITINCALVLGG